jgi:hypothetical protein
LAAETTKISKNRAVGCLAVTAAAAQPVVQAGVVLVVTAIRPLPGRTWLGMCECGLESLCPDQESALVWLQDHECAEFEPYNESLFVSL